MSEKESFNIRVYLPTIFYNQNLPPLKVIVLLSSMMFYTLRIMMVFQECILEVVGPHRWEEQIGEWEVKCFLTS